MVLDTEVLHRGSGFIAQGEEEQNRKRGNPSILISVSCNQNN